MKRLITTLLAAALLCCTVPYVLAESESAGSEAENTASRTDGAADEPEKTAEPMEVSPAASSEVYREKPEEDAESYMDLSGRVLITGKGTVVYNVGAPLLKQTIVFDGNKYTVSMSTFEGLEIFYTRDGSTPLPGAPNTLKYSTPQEFVVSGEGADKNNQLQVVVVDPKGDMDGKLASEYFKDVDAEAIATPEPDKYTVSFVTNTDSKADAQTMYAGEKAFAPTEITKNGYSLEGWYKESSFKTKWSFDSPVSENMTLYAKWFSTDVTISSTAHTIDNDAKTITPDKNSSVSEFLRQIRFPNNTNYKITLNAQPVSAKNPVAEGMVLEITAQDGKTTVKYTVKSKVNENGEVIAPAAAAEPTAVPAG